MKRGRCARMLLGSMCLLAATAAHAQGWPAKALRFVVPFPPGGGNDILARVVAEKLGQGLGQPVLIDNKPGAGGNIGTDIVAKSPADGYTVLLTNAALPIIPSLFAKLPFDVQADFEHVASVGTSQFVLVAGPTVPSHNVQEFIAFARARPGKLSFASVGVGTPLHLGIELFKSMTGIELLHVPYKGTAPALTDLAAGRIDVMFPTYSGAKAFLDSGKIRLLAAGGTARMQAAPDVPTINEAGVKGFGVDGWYGLAVAAKTPDAVVNRMAQEVKAVTAQADVREKLTVLGFDITYEGPRELRQRIQREAAMWAKLIKEVGIKPE
jgi:tripartite-type tricarboxylate transporter receptor subunit TctC